MQSRWFFYLRWKVVLFHNFIISITFMSCSRFQHWDAAFCMRKLGVPSQKADSEETEAKLIESLVPISTTQIRIKPTAGESSYYRIFLTLHSLSLSLLTTNHRDFLSHWSIDNYTCRFSLSPPSTHKSLLTFQLKRRQGIMKDANLTLRRIPSLLIVANTRGGKSVRLPRVPNHRWTLVRLRRSLMLGTRFGQIWPIRVSLVLCRRRPRRAPSREIFAAESIACLRCEATRRHRCWDLPQICHKISRENAPGRRREGGREKGGGAEEEEEEERILRGARFLVDGTFRVARCGSLPFPCELMRGCSGR